MRLLLVAPDQVGVSWSQEIERVTSDFSATVMTGELSEERLLNATSGKKYDVLHIAAHGDDAGIHLGHGFTMPPTALAALARHVQAQLVFLNMCHSVYLPQYLIDQHVPAVLCHTTDVLDSTALRLAAYFYEEVGRNGGDLHAAYLAVSLHDGTLAWSSNGKYVERSVAPLLERMGSLEQLSAGQGASLAHIDVLARRLMTLVVAEGAGLIGMAGLYAAHVGGLV